LNIIHQPSAPVSARFVVGIDLGTTNSAVAYVDTMETTPGDTFHTRIFPAPQLIASGETEARETLPSFHYEPAPGEFDENSLRLPWETNSSGFVGVFARDHGADVPGRLIASAKSWLSHSGVDRTADLLPWHGSADVTKLSPTEVSARFLTHIRLAWNHLHPGHPLEEQDVVITIPASFDEVARQLTVAAARRAGLSRIVLLEEPQAAFYAWMREQAQTPLVPGQTILVCDVGGGTSDFTLIQVQPEKEGWLRFHRFAVGDHLILGGDNLDLALAHFVEDRLGGKLEPRQWSVLIQRCRQAKEILLGQDAPECVTLSVPAPGSKLVAGARQIELTRDEVTKLLVDGFLPRVALDEKPAKRASGFQEFGLPYAADPAITRYLAAFLTAAPGTARPDVLLFNGGLFESPLMRDRLLEVLASWFAEKDWRPQVLKNERMDLAVALGAARYGMVRRGSGVRISGGLAHSYYIGVEQGEAPAALCLVPAGLEEGQGIDLLDKKFDLLVSQPAEFPLYVSSARTTDKPGDIVPLDGGQLTALPSIRTALRASTHEGGAVQVHLHARLTEIGALEVWCAEPGGGRRWKLQFDVRAATRTGGRAGEEAGFVDEQTAARCRERIREAFASTGGAQPEALVKHLEHAAGMGRNDWPPSLLRNFWEELIHAGEGRARSPAHEARWLNLLGFSLRPGYGFAVDDWRVARTWQLASKGVVHQRSELCRAEWWILWRRVAGGLAAGQQRALAEPLVAAIRKARSGKTVRRPGQAHAADPLDGSHEASEIWRMLGAFEWMSAAVKIELAEILLELLETGRAGASWRRAALWTLGRLGARVPMVGPLNTLAPAEAVEKWISRLLQAAGTAASTEDLFFALMQMARCTGDRYRDISTRKQVLDWMNLANAPAHYVELVRSAGTLREEEQDSIFGETLPHGLRLMA